MKKSLAFFALFAVLASMVRLCAETSKFLSEVVDVPLPGRATRFDYQGLDPKTGKLFLSHMGDGELVVFDIKKRKVIASLPGFPETTGVLAIPELHEVYASVPGNHEVAIVDSKTLKEIARVPAGDFPDGLAYAPKAHKVFVSDESGGRETVIDTTTHKGVEMIDMGGEVGNTQYDSASGMILANVQTLDELVVIDPTTDKIVGRHKLKGADHNHGLLIDAPARLAFSACEGNDKLLTVDLRNFQVTQVFSVGGGPDVLAFDPGLKRLYVACEDGVVSIFQLQGDKLEKMEDAEWGSNSHTVSVDPKSHLVYLPLKNVGDHPLLRILKEVIK